MLNAWSSSAFQYHFEYFEDPSWFVSTSPRFKPNPKNSGQICRQLRACFFPWNRIKSIRSIIHQGSMTSHKSLIFILCGLKKGQRKNSEPESWCSCPYCWWFRNPAITTWDVVSIQKRYVKKKYGGSTIHWWTLDFVAHQPLSLQRSHRFS